MIPGGKLIAKVFAKHAKPLLENVVLTICKQLKTPSTVVKCGCGKRYRIDYGSVTSAEGIKEITVMTEVGDDCCSSQRPPKLAQFRDTERTELVEKLMVVLSAEVSDAVFDETRAESDIEGVYPPVTMWKIFQEKRAENDLDKDDDLHDIQAHMAGQSFPHLSEVNTYTIKGKPAFRVIMTSADLVTVFDRFLKDKRYACKRVLLDATGKITRKINEKQVLHHVLLVPYPIKDSEQCHLVPVAEPITDDSTGENISLFLRKIKSLVSTAVFKLLTQIGTDHSSFCCATKSSSHEVKPCPRKFC